MHMQLQLKRSRSGSGGTLDPKLLHIRTSAQLWLIVINLLSDTSHKTPNRATTLNTTLMLCLAYCSFAVNNIWCRRSRRIYGRLTNMSMSCDISAAKQLVCQSNCNNPNCKQNPQSEASQCLHGQNQKPPLSNLSHHMSVLLGIVWHAHTRAGGRNTRKPPTPNTCKERSEPTTTEQTTTLRRPYGYDMNALP